MLIRSQSGKILLNVSQVAYCSIVRECQIWAFIPNRETGIWLGEYASGQRAIEVLNQIEAYYDKYATRDENMYSHVSAVFQMPEE